MLALIKPEAQLDEIQCVISTKNTKRENMSSEELPLVLKRAPQLDEIQRVILLKQGLCSSNFVLEDLQMGQIFGTSSHRGRENSRHAWAQPRYKIRLNV